MENTGGRHIEKYERLVVNLNVLICFVGTTDG